MNMKNRDVWRQHYFFLFFSCQFFLAVVLNCALKSPCAITPMCGQCKRNRGSVNWNIRSDLFCISWILFPLVHKGDHFMLQSAVNLSLPFVAVTSQQRLSCFFFLFSVLSSAFFSLLLRMFESPKVHDCLHSMACLSEVLLAAALEFNGRFCSSFLKRCCSAKVMMPSVTAACSVY